MTVMRTDAVSYTHLEFEGGRHQRRVDMIMEIEEEKK